MSKKLSKKIEIENKIIFDYLDKTDIEEIIRLWIERQTYNLKRDTLDNFPIYITQAIQDLQSMINDFKHSVN